MRTIDLTKGKFAIVDDADYAQLSRYKWYAQRSNSRFYAARESGEQTVYMHREIMAAPPKTEVDHINGNGLDNRRGNLRVCSKAENQHNRRLNRNSTSGYKGVRLIKDSRKWEARIKVNGKMVSLGCFVNKLEAARAYDQAALKHFGEFARLNGV